VGKGGKWDDTQGSFPRWVSLVRVCLVFLNLLVGFVFVCRQDIYFTRKAQIELRRPQMHTYMKTVLGTKFFLVSFAE
jgi:hypothetical protein